MSPQEQRIAIAEACGNINAATAKTIRDFPELIVDFPHSVPDYLADLNAMHEAEKVLDEKQQRAYAMMLHPIMTYAHPMNQDFQVAHATGKQRAEAFLRTIGKWREST